jgi:hypothetical protein
MVRVPIGPTTTALEVGSFLRDELLPFAETLVGEIGEMDEAIDDLVHQTPDVLHTESATVFASVLAAGSAIAAELRTRAGNDARLLRALREFDALVKEAKVILDDIVISDTDEEVGDDEATDDVADDDETTETNEANQDLEAEVDIQDGAR